MVAARRIAPLPLCLVMAGLWSASGCTPFRNESASAPQGSAFAWLTNWASQPMEAGGGFDVESLRPDPRPVSLGPGDLLEVTIWDLDEPGKPYTFPVRVSEKRTIEVPLLGEFSVADRTSPQVEAKLIDAYRAGELLVNPRLLVRSLDPALVKVQVSGAVQRPGYVELARADTSIYAALVSAGGATKAAGTRVVVLRRSKDTKAVIAATAATTRPGPTESAGPASLIVQGPLIVRGQQPEQYSNSAEELTVETPRGAPAERRAVAAGSYRPNPVPSVGPNAGTSLRGVNDSRPEEWAQDAGSHRVDSKERGADYDVTKTAEREALRAIRLEEGDEVIVKAATLPVRIEGVVRRPGPYPLSPDHNVNVWQAIEMAGGVRLSDIPLNITLIHVAGDGHPASRESLHVAQYDKHPLDAPRVHPGDVLHVEPPAGTRIKRAVGDLWR